MNKTTLFIVIVALFFSAYVYASAKRKLDYDLDKLPDPAPDQGIKDFDNLVDQF